MYKFLGSAIVLAVVSVGAVDHFDQRKERLALISSEHITVAKPKPLESHPKRSAGKARAKRDNRGHYMFKARMNGRNIPVLVDTGASAVAINEKTARKIGISVSKSDFRYKANTANGTVQMAHAVIRDVRIGGVRVRDVTAAILPNESLDGVLLGMSFLNKLDRFEFSDGELVLYE